MNKYDVAIIGAGPAGLSAAITCRKQALKVVLIDEFPYAGGRLLGQLYEEGDGTWWNGIEEAENLKKEAEDLQVHIQLERSVHHIEQTKASSFIVHTNHGTVNASNVLIATGAAESPCPIPGWTLPGVMSIGAAQVMTNLHRVKVGDRGIIAGVNILSVAIARELQLAGIDIHSINLPNPQTTSKEDSHPKVVMEKLTHLAHLAPSSFIRMGSSLAKFQFIRDLAVQFYPRSGMPMWGMPIHLRKAIIQINGSDQVESVTLARIRPDGSLIAGSEEEVAVDFVCIAGGLYPLAELAATMGLPFQYVPELGGHIPLHNQAMETPIEGVYIAGNITGIENAKIAMKQGTVAGLSIAYRQHQDEAIEKARRTAIEDVEKTRAEASIQFDPQIEEGRKKVEAKFWALEG